WHIRPRTRCTTETDGGHLQPPLSERVLLSADRISNCRAGEPAWSATVDHRDCFLWNHRIGAGSTDENDECQKRLPHHFQLDNLPNSRIPARLRPHKAPMTETRFPARPRVHWKPLAYVPILT